MSRRRGEFEHRTSIFEGAFRAWSHLGGLEPEDLENKPAADLDPLTTPIEGDQRVSSSKATPRNPDGTARREYPYEPLPRSGLSHPYVQAILSPWLGPDADNEAIQLGLTTLRTWWQHRRKGESGSAIAALGTEKMKGVVEGYTRHFFTLAHCLVVNDKEQPPRTLHGKMKELDKLRSKRNKKRGRAAGGSGADGKDAAGMAGAAAGGVQLPDTMSAALNADLTDSTLSPLERLHAAQRRQLAESNFAPHGTAGTAAAGGDATGGVTPIINIKGKCIPGKVDLPGVVDAVSRQATQLAHRGVMPGAVLSNGMVRSGSAAAGGAAAAAAKDEYGDPNVTPVVFVSGTGDIQIAMTIDGITCAHCVKIVETVLKGCNGNKSPIDGLLDAAADRVLNSVLIRIDRASSAKRIAFEAARNLAMVGYTAKAKEMSIVGQGADKKATMDLGSLSTAFEVVANTDAKDVFDWTIPCTCPDNGVLRQDCARHSQMNTRIFEAFESREQQVKNYMAGCGMQYGMECTCGPDCRCQDCPVHSRGGQGGDAQNNQNGVAGGRVGGGQAQQQQQPQHAPLDQAAMFEAPLQVDQTMDFFGMEPPTGGAAMGPPAAVPVAAPAPPPAAAPVAAAAAPAAMNPPSNVNTNNNNDHVRAQRNPSVISYGNGLRHMSLTSETTFGRAMSGLSALSIDWENLEDFDVDVDHSAHINNNNNTNSPTKMAAGYSGGDHHHPHASGHHPSHHHAGHHNAAGGGSGMMARPRSSMRRSFMAHSAAAAAAAASAVAAGAAAAAAASAGEPPSAAAHHDHRVSFKE